MFNIFKSKKPTGVVPSIWDERDYQYKISGMIYNRSIDLRDKFPKATNQLSYQSCTAHAVCALLDYELKYNKQLTKWDFDSSEAFLWYVTRLEEGTQLKNVGVQLRNVFKSIKKYGFVRGEAWTYNDGIFVRPSQNTFIEGQMFELYLKQLPSYFAINTQEEIINALDNNHPVVFAIPVTSEFMQLDEETFNDGIVDTGNYHAMLIVGYTNQGLIVRNSWGLTWGKEGYCILPWEDFNRHAFDKWCLQ